MVGNEEIEKKPHWVKDENGKFIRKHQPFSLENFNDGYIDIYGRFKVYLPTHHRADKSGYVFRSIVAYELYHDVIVTKDMVIHHIDRNTLNDSKENLKMIEKGVHTSIHNQPRIVAATIKRVCMTCGKTFTLKKYQLNSPNRKGKYCSTKCYYKSMKGMSRVPNSGRRKHQYYVKCKYCGNEFRTSKSKFENPKSAVFCSNNCKNDYMRGRKMRDW